MRHISINNLLLLIGLMLLPFLGWGQTYTVTTLAGSGNGGATDGIGTAASFDWPTGIAVDRSGNIYVADYRNHRIRKVSPSGVVSTFAGSGTAGYADGIGTVARFNNPQEVALDNLGNVYVTDANNHRIRKISPSGVVTTLAGSSVGYIDGIGSTARFASPEGIAVDFEGNVYVTDGRIRKISPSGVVTTLAGSGNSGYANGTGTEASFYWPRHIEVDGAGNLFLADQRNHCIRKISPSGIVTTFSGFDLLAGQFFGGYFDGLGTIAMFNAPTGVTIDGLGNKYVADYNNHRIRKISPTGFVTTISGSGSGAYSDGIGSSASFNYPRGIAVDSAGNIYVADQYNNRIRKLSPSEGVK